MSEDVGLKQGRATSKGRRKYPEQYAGCYSLDLYCDHHNGRHGWNEFPHTFTGNTFAECAKQARSVGWKISRATRTATCPKCARGYRL